MSRSTVFTRLLRRRILPTSSNFPSHPFVRARSPSSSVCISQIARSYASNFQNLSINARVAASEAALNEISNQAARERQREREEKIKAGLSVADIDKEEEEDFLGVGPLIEKLEKRNAKDKPSMLNVYEERSDSDSESDDEESMNKRFDMFEKKFEKHQELLDKFVKTGL